MIPVQDAVKVALDQLHQLMPEYAGPAARLEEVELSEKDDAWLITFSAPEREHRPANALMLDAADPFSALGRVAKVVKIRGDDGKLLWIKQRTA